MLNLSHSSNNFDSVYSEIGDRFEKPRLPRHVSALESPSHSRKVSNSLFQTVRQCPLKHEHNAEEASNLAINILRYQLQDSVSQQKHLENLLSNLKYRLQVAQATANKQLVTMLQSELGQLEAIRSVQFKVT